jgi:hypothetical protein
MFLLFYQYCNLSREHAATEQVGTMVMHLVCILDGTGSSLGPSITILTIFVSGFTQLFHANAGIVP